MLTQSINQEGRQVQNIKNLMSRTVSFMLHAFISYSNQIKSLCLSAELVFMWRQLERGYTGKILRGSGIKLCIEISNIYFLNFFFNVKVLIIK